MPSDDIVPDRELTVDEILAHLEFGLWTAVALSPVFYWVNGAAVSDDQWVMRLILIVIAFGGAPIIRFVRWKRSRSESGQDGLPTTKQN